MFAGFNLKIDESDILGDFYYETGLQILSKDKNIIERSLHEYICNNQFLDGSSIQRNWFPQINSDVFISHSHQDENLVVSLAGWLYEIFGIKSFVDSYIWGYADNLLKIIDDEYCLNEEGSNKTYNYNKRNYSTSHVHMMLATALTKMIDKTECLFFVNTPASIEVSETINYKTASPWIYYELQASEVIRHKKLIEYRRIPIEKRAKFEDKLHIIYDVNINHLTNLDRNDLLEWWKTGRKSICEYPLDTLYKNKGILGSSLYD